MAETTSIIKLTKYEHACLVLNKAGVRLVIDPGCFTKLPADLTNIACVVVTEEHVDHFDLDNLKAILKQSPQTKIFTTTAVHQQLRAEQIDSAPVTDTKTIEVAGYKLTFYETDHAPIHKKSPCKSLALKIDDYLYYPSDSYHTIDDAVEVLALPTSGPWHKVAEAIDFANAVNAPIILATHNGLYNAAGHEVTNSFITKHLSNPTRKFVHLEAREHL